MGKTRNKSPLADIREWRAKDRNTGIDKSGGIPYKYEHVVMPPPVQAEVYRIETYIPYIQPTPIHRNVHYVPGNRLDRFFDGWDEHAETIVDIRPLTITQALAEIAAFQAATGK